MDYDTGFNEGFRTGKTPATREDCFRFALRYAHYHETYVQTIMRAESLRKYFDDGTIPPELSPMRPDASQSFQAKGATKPVRA